MAGVLMSSPEEGSVPPTSMRMQSKVKLDSCRAGTSLMLQRSLEESSVGEVTGNGTGSHKMGKTMGRESCPAPGNPGEGEPSFPPTSPSVPSFPESSVFQHPVRSLNVLIPPLVLTIPMLFF